MQRPLRRRRDRPMTMTHTVLRSQTMAAALLATGLIVVLTASCFMYTFLAQSLTRGATSEPKTDACVIRAEDNTCQVYPCLKHDGATQETPERSPFFGYAGNFVHREGDLKKPLPEGWFGTATVSVLLWFAASLLVHACIINNRCSPWRYR